MTMTAPVSGSLATLARLAALPLPGDAPAVLQQPRSSDVVVFSSAPFRLLSDLASAGLRELGALLPALEQALQDGSAASLGRLAKAAGLAARQIGDGHVALLAEGPERVAAALRGEVPAPAEGQPLPEPSDPRTTETLRAVARQITVAERLAAPHPPDPEAAPIQCWLDQASLALQSTGDALDHAERRLSTEPQATAPVQDAPTAWALGQIAAAQAEVSVARRSLGQSLGRTAAPAGSRALPLDRFASATATAGALLALAVLWLAGGVWAVVTGAAGLFCVGLWLLRLSRASSIKLDVRR